MELGRMNASDSAIQVAGATARDSLSMNQQARAWLVGVASRRDVQISRALLAQRLNTSTRDGDLTGELFETELGEPLLQFDQAFSSAPSGLLSPADQEIWLPRMAAPIIAIEEAAKDIISRQEGLSDSTEKRAVSEDQQLGLWQLRLSALVLLLAGLLFYFLWRAIRVNYRQAQEILSEEQADLDQSLLKLQRIKEFEQDESRLLQLIISGSQLEDVFTEIAAVALNVSAVATAAKSFEEATSSACS